MKKSRALFVAACGLALIAAGCGRKDTTPPAGDAASRPADAPAAMSGRLIEINGDDAMKFSVTEIRAKPGETLTVTLHNIGIMPKFSMGHNWVLLRSPDVVDVYVSEAAQAATTDYVPQGRANDMIAYTRLLGPKESDSVTFNAPKEPGRYPYLCSFPGHYQLGMRGELIVEN